jgi:hypothetical protein
MCISTLSDSKIMYLFTFRCLQTQDPIVARGLVLGAAISVTTILMKVLQWQF